MISCPKPDAQFPMGGACLNFAHFSMQFCNPVDPKGGAMAQWPPLNTPLSVNAFFVNWCCYSIFLYHSIQQMVLVAIRFLSSLVANMATITIHFQQKFTLVRSFQHFAINSEPKRFLARLTEYFKIFVMLARKMLRFFLHKLISCNRSKQLSERK